MENKDITSTIDQDILHRYIQGLATDEEIRMVEQAMGDDVFLQDAIEGLKEVKDKNIISAHLADITADIGQKTSYYPSKAGKTIQLPQLSFKAIISIAASIVIISGTYLIAHTLIKGNKQIAQNTNTKQTQAQNKVIVLDEKTITLKPNDKNDPRINTTITEENLIINTTKEKALESNTIYSPAPIEANEKPIATYNWTLPSTANMSKEEITSKNIVKGQILDSKTKTPIAGVNIISGKTTTLSSQNGYYEIAVEDGVNNIEYSQSGYQDQAKKLTTTSGAKTINIELNKSFDSDIALNAAKDKESVTDEKMSSDVTTSTDDFKKGLDAYSNQEYEKAIVSFNKVLQKNPNSPEANYYNGLANYNTNKNTKALGYFNKVIKANNKYSLDAKWQKAQILLQQNNYTEAKPILEELKNTTKYKSQAEAIINTKK